jgi:hypothetical protein
MLLTAGMPVRVEIQQQELLQNHSDVANSRDASKSRDTCNSRDACNSKNAKQGLQQAETPATARALSSSGTKSMMLSSRINYCKIR